MNSISDVEVAASSLFAALRKVKLSPELEEIRDYLFPEGMAPVVQLEEDGRKKRSSAAPWNWSPKTGEIRIFQEPVLPTPPRTSEPKVPSNLEEAPGQQTKPVTIGVSVSPAPPIGHDRITPADISLQTGGAAVADDRITPEEVIECCQALAAAEKANRQFTSLKWFRDNYLPTVDFPWTRSPQRRQRVLSEAIDLGRIDTKKISNPKSEFPTMTIGLNRSMPIPGVAPRFQPITVRGEAVSATLLRDRGNN
jgi:hypothetical protein